jgi:hypothetical protein
MGTLALQSVGTCFLPAMIGRPRRRRPALATAIRSPLLVLVASALGVMAAAVPEAYQVVARRNPFSPLRTPAVAPVSPVIAEAPPPTEAITLTGVVSLGGQPTALFSGSSAGLSGVRRPGEKLDLGAVKSVDTLGVTIDTGTEAGLLRLAVGQSLRHVVGQPWALSTEASPAGSTPAAPAAVSGAPSAPGETAPPASGAPAGDSGDMLQRLLERRKKELNP